MLTSEDMVKCNGSCTAQMLNDYFTGTVEPSSKVLSHELFCNTPKLRFRQFMILNYVVFRRFNYMNPQFKLTITVVIPSELQAVYSLSLIFQVYGMVHF